MIQDDVNLYHLKLIEMAFLKIHTTPATSIIIIIAGLLISGFLLLFGIANLINPDVPDAYLQQNTKVCLIVCGIGLIFLLPVTAAIRGIISKKKIKKEEHNTNV